MIPPTRLLPTRVFAYGSNLPFRRMAARIEASVKDIGALPRHELRFNKLALDGSGKANVVPVANPKANVWGAIYELPPDELAKLDGFEAKYFREEELIHTAHGPVKAWVYKAEPEAVQEGLLPYDWYLDHVLRGAREQRLPEPYVDWLARTVPVRDPDRARFAAEQAVHLGNG